MQWPDGNYFLCTKKPQQKRNHYDGRANKISMTTKNMHNENTGENAFDFN